MDDDRTLLDDPRLEAALARAAAHGDVGLLVEDGEVPDADARALALYREEKLTGVLIYVSLGSREIRILDAERRDLGDLAATIARGFAEGDPVRGLVEALDRVATSRASIPGVA